jgi:hypothetical protein
MVAPIKFLSGRQQQQKIGVEGSTENQKVLEVIGRVGIGTTIFDADYNLDVRGSANISGILSVGQIIAGAGNTFSDLTVTGISTFQSDVTVGGGLTVTGISTFSSLIDANGGIDASTLKVEDLTENRIVIAGVDGELEDDGNLTFDGSTLVVGAALSASSVQVNNNLNVDGDTELDELYVTGLTTFLTTVNISIGELHGPQEFIIDPAAVGDNTGLVRIKGDLYVDGTEFIVNSTTIELADFKVGIATTVGTNLLLDGAGISIGSTDIIKTFTYNNTSNTLESSIGLGVTVGGEFKTGSDSVLNRTTLGTTVVNSSLTSVGTLLSLDVNGHTELDTLNVSGLSTFASNVDINASVDVSNDVTVGGALSVTGLSTFASDLDINASIDVNGHTELDTLNVSVATTTAKLYIGINSVGITTILDEDNFTSNSDTALATQQSIKAYVDGEVSTAVGNVSLGFTGDTGSGSIDLDSETFTIAGTINEIVTVGSGNTLTIGLPNIVAITTSLTVGSSIGIGTTNPTQSLDVDGNVAIGGSVYDVNDNLGASNEVLMHFTGIGVSWSVYDVDGGLFI